MCESVEEARANCKHVYGHENAVQPDHMPDGHYYSSMEDTCWLVHPSDDSDDGSNDGPGVTGIRNGAKPLCQLAKEKREAALNEPLPYGMVAAPPAQPMEAPDPSIYPKFVNDFSTKNVFKKSE